MPLVSKAEPKQCARCNWRGTSNAQRRTEYFKVGYLIVAVVMIGLSTFEIDIATLLTRGVSIGICVALVAVPVLLELSDHCPACAARLPFRL